MSIDQFTEDSYEQALIELFQGMGYQYECGYDVERDFREVTHIYEGTLEQRNEQFMDYLQSGVEVKYNEEGREKTALVKLVNFDDAKLNDFKV